MNLAGAVHGKKHTQNLVGALAAGAPRSGFSEPYAQVPKKHAQSMYTLVVSINECIGSL